MKNRIKLENCACKTQVMPPSPKPVLTPCPIFTHDPQQCQSQNCSNFVKSYIFECKKTHAHLQYAFNSCAKFQNECLKTLRGVDYTILLPLNET